MHKYNSWARRGVLFAVAIVLSGVFAFAVACSSEGETETAVVEPADLEAKSAATVAKAEAGAIDKAATQRPPRFTRTPTFTVTATFTVRPRRIRPNRLKHQYLNQSRRTLRHLRRQTRLNRRRPTHRHRFQLPPRLPFLIHQPRLLLRPRLLRLPLRIPQRRLRPILRYRRRHQRQNQRQPRSQNHLRLTPRHLNRLLLRHPNRPRLQHQSRPRYRRRRRRRQ